MSQTQIGVCGHCGGPVMREDGPLWLVGPWPRPSCGVCGATVQQMEDRVLPMNPRPERQAHRQSDFDWVKFIARDA